MKIKIISGDFGRNKKAKVKVAKGKVAYIRVGWLTKILPDQIQASKIVDNLHSLKLGRLFWLGALAFFWKQKTNVVALQLVDNRRLVCECPQKASHLLLSLGQQF